jgi:hypothetical protein
VTPRDGRVPDRVYEISPALGRVLDDALDDDPAKRLLLLHPDPSGSVDFAELSAHLRDTFALVDLEPAAGGSRRARWWARLAPASHEPWSLCLRYRSLATRERPRPGAGDLGYLALFSALGATAWWLVAVTCAVVLLGDVARPGTASRSPAGIAVAASIAALAHGMSASKYYQTVLARLTVRRVEHPLARLAEWSMRGTTLVALPAAVLGAGWRPQLWAWTCAAGAAAVAGTSYVTVTLARRLTCAGRAEFSTVPPPAWQVPGGYGRWWWTTLAYALAVAGVALGLQAGVLRDMPAYVGALAVLSIGVHYAGRCVAGGPAARGGLARAFATGERLTLLRARASGPGAAQIARSAFSQ